MCHCGVGLSENLKVDGSIYNSAWFCKELLTTMMAMAMTKMLTTTQILKDVDVDVDVDVDDNPDPERWLGVGRLPRSCLSLSHFPSLSYFHTFTLSHFHRF